MRAVLLVLLATPASALHINAAFRPSSAAAQMCRARVVSMDNISGLRLISGDDRNNDNEHLMGGAASLSDAEYANKIHARRLAFEELTAEPTGVCVEAEKLNPNSNPNPEDIGVKDVVARSGAPTMLVEPCSRYGPGKCIFRGDKCNEKRCKVNNAPCKVNHEND